MKIYNKLYLILSLTAFLVSGSLQAKQIVYDTDDWHIPRTLSFDSSYLPSLIFIKDDGVKALETNRALADFGVELFQAHSFLFDQLTHTRSFDETILFRGALFKLDALVNTYLSWTYLTAFHEQGHAARFTSRGLGGTSFDGPNNFFGYWLSRFEEPLSGMTRGAPPLNVNDDIIIAAAGVNNEMRFAGQISDQMYFSKGHVTDWTPYFWGKVSSLLYTKDDMGGSDFSALLADYRFKGYDIDRKDIDTGNILSIALSSSTWRYAYGILAYLGSNDTVVQSWEVGGFRIPDLEAYINRRGQSYKIKSGYRVDDNFLIPFSLEFIAKGDDQVEVTVGARKRFRQLPKWSFGADLHVSRGVGSSVYIAAKPYKHFQWMLGMDQHNINTFHGERNMTTTKPRTIGYEVWTKLSLVY